MIMNKFKKIAAILLIITLSLISFVYADNDNVANVDGSGGVSGGVGGYNENKNYMWQDKNVRAARVSLWDIENQTLVYGLTKDLIDYSRISKSDVEKARRLTKLSKPQIINMNYKYSKDGNDFERIVDNIERYLDYQIDDIPLEETTYQTMSNPNTLYPESITFPDFYVTWTSDSHDGSDDTRLKHLKEWYSQDEHVEEILNAFSATEDIIEKYKNQKISILIEPLLYFGTNNNECEVRNERKGITEKFKFKETAWFMTAAEIGLLAKNGFAKYNSNLQAFDCIGNRHEEKEFIVPVSGHGGIGEVLYLYLPYGTYKENDNFINAIKSYKQEGAVSRINTEAGFEQMVKQLGCFEITASTSEIKNPAKVLLKYHSNLEQIGGIGSIDETYNKNVKIGDTILTNKTYPDSIASSYHKPDGSNYTYNSYTTIAGINGNSGSGKRFKVGKATQITNDLLRYATKETLKDENNKEYDLYTLILYVDWVFEESGDISPSLTLYEDELSYVYDYNSIDSSGETRKLQAKINNGGNQHPYNMCSHKTCYSTSEGNFTVSVSHNFIGADKENCVLNEQQETIGDDTYGIFGQEQDTPFVLSTGKEINHSFVGYRDKEKDKRTAYKDSSKNTAQANNALPKYDISYKEFGAKNML